MAWQPTTATEQHAAQAMYVALSTIPATTSTRALYGDVAVVPVAAQVRNDLAKLVLEGGPSEFGGDTALGQLAMKVNNACERFELGGWRHAETIAAHPDQFEQAITDWETHTNAARDELGDALGYSPVQRD